MVDTCLLLYMPRQIKPEEKRSNRISVSLDDGTVDLLFRYAKGVKNSKPATVAAYLLASRLDDLNQMGEIPENPDMVEMEAQDFSQIVEYIKLLLGDRTSRQGISFVLLGEILEIDPQRLQNLHNLIAHCTEKEEKIV